MPYYLESPRDAIIASPSSFRTVSYSPIIPCLEARGCNPFPTWASLGLLALPFWILQGCYDSPTWNPQGTYYSLR